MCELGTKDGRDAHFTSRFHSYLLTEECRNSGLLDSFPSPGGEYTPVVIDLSALVSRNFFVSSYLPHTHWAPEPPSLPTPPSSISHSSAFQ